MRVDVIKALCHLTGLEKLIIKYDQNFTINKEDLAKCTAKEVEVKDFDRYRNRAQNETLINNILEMENIEKLTVDSLDLNPERSKFHEKLKYLKVTKCVNGCNLKQLLNNFLGLQHLECGDFTYNSNRIATPRYLDNTIFSDLKHLSLNGGNSCLPRLLSSLPNLEILLLKSLNKDGAIYLNMFLSMPKLKELTVAFINTSTDHKTFVALKNLCSKLTKFTITFFETTHDFTEMLEKELSNEYDLLKFHKKACILKGEKYLV